MTFSALGRFGGLTLVDFEEWVLMGVLRRSAGVFRLKCPGADAERPRLFISTLGSVATVYLFGVRVFVTIECAFDEY